MVILRVQKKAEILEPAFQGEIQAETGKRGGGIQQRSRPEFTCCDNEGIHFI